MKKTLILSLIFAAAIFVGACDNKNESPVLGAKVDVSVKNSLGAIKAGETVYLYKDTEPTIATKPGDANAKVVTNDKGVAEFSLNFTQLNILESQTTLYFVVFYQFGDASAVAGTGAVTVKRNDAKKLDIKILL